MRLSSTLFVFVLAFGCRTADPTTIVRRTAGGEDAPLAQRELRGELEALAPAQTIAVACEESATEACNGIDDDCDAAIDEGSCQFGSGPLQVTMAWDSGADLDLYITEPSGEPLSFQRSSSATGGHLDQAARGECEPADAHPRVENAFWREAPPPGEYVISVHYLFQCSADAGLSTATLSVRLGDRRFDPVNVSLAPNERVDVIRLRVE